MALFENLIRTCREKSRWYNTTCCYCGKHIKVKIPISLFNRNKNLLNGNACCTCVPLNSRIRNGIDESAFDTKDCE